MWFKKNTIRLVSLLLIVSVLKYCIIYRQEVIPPGQPLNIEGKTIIVNWGEESRYLNDVILTGNEIQGYFTLIQPYPKTDQEVHIYPDTAAVTPNVKTNRLHIPFSAIEKVEIIDIDVGMTVFATVGTIVAALGLVFLIILLTKESCPFIYAFNGETYIFEGEIYSGAIHPPLERHDYLPLPHLTATDSEYRVRMSNEVKEIQYTNLAELQVFDHPSAVDVLVDKYGTPHTLTQILPPLSAKNLNQHDIKRHIVKMDSLNYMGDPLFNDDILMDGIILTFDKPQKAKKAKLFVRAKNSFWLDYIYGQFYDLFGDDYHDWFEDQKTNSEEKMKQWALDQGIPLSVYIEKDGKWQFVDYFNTVGPMAFKQDVLALDISELHSENLRIKLEFGFLFWEIDYAAIDFSSDIVVEKTVVQVNSAVDQSDKDVSSLLYEDDDCYFTMSAVGDQAILKFSATEIPPNTSRTVYFHSKGHYEVIRNPVGSPDIGYLLSFKKPGRFIEFSRQRFRYLQNSLKK